ncbi:MAG: hypothetical protein ACK5H4_07075 [Lacrimispora sphenoides]
MNVRIQDENEANMQQTNELVNQMQLSPFKVKSNMHSIYTTDEGVTIAGVWNNDVGTKAQQLNLAVIYQDGEVSPIHEYSKSKLTQPKALADLGNLCGIDIAQLEPIYKQLKKDLKVLPVQNGGSGKISLKQAYLALCEHVDRYAAPGKVFCDQNYGYILASDLQSVLDKLEIGYTRLELEKNFKVWGLLQVSEKADHPYSYMVGKAKAGGHSDWFFSFKLPGTGSKKGGIVE